MEKAGLAAADLARKLIGTGKCVLVLAGPGNNGGDGLVAARWLKERGFSVAVVFSGSATNLPPDAKAAHDQWAAAGGTTLTELPQGDFDLVIDALFGIGLARAPEGIYPKLIEYINAQPAPVLALDIPTGLDADTGRVNGLAVEADHTLTFIGLKPGLFTLEGPDHAGEVHLADLGVPAGEEVAGFLMDKPPCLPPRRRKNSHKGSYGDVAVIGGAETMVGAAFMAARAALLMGSGRVFVGLLAQHAPTVDLRQPELMVRQAASVVALEHLDVLIVGPGLGRSPAAHDLLAQALQHSAALVLDADALNLIAATPELQALLRQRRPGSTVITPHPGEAATLLHTDTAAVQADRVAAACRLASSFNAVTVLKGCGSLVATPDGRWFLNTSGNPGMAAAGMGDVLAGIIGGLIAQRLDAESATLVGVHLHGAAGDALVADGIGPVGLTASEVAQEARNLLNLWMKTNG
ncbi:ADP-dependent (S)-NAD(P)H-hydrate dehydratase [Novimethylophilus kurashikiensis]|uniref:Bifunctional NAD(P)H-hydrate repair enzyme n=2 Tax=Novimethylophilus kurashikiensis TaxID=1825523 RepID=A0A2R5FEF0_9PROT|nr:ADP-dependent (S)-NAD(P)H-hydrate dehydratase [Novimethylophilus kurashikiensis]